IPDTRDVLRELSNTLLDDCYRNWPQEPAPLNAALTNTWTAEGSRLREFQFDSETPFRLTFYVLDPEQGPATESLEVEILDQQGWDARMGALANAFPEFDRAPPSASGEKLAATGTKVFFTPRGLGPTAWTTEPARERQNR